MGVLHNSFHEQVRDIWGCASKLNKPVHDSITWTCGLINGRGDFDDLQTHGLALASSIVIHSPVVPKIIFGWDAPVTCSELASHRHLREKTYPVHLMDVFPSFTQEMLSDEKLYDCYSLDSKYLSLQRTPLSVTPWPYSLGLGYRAKYLGAQYSMTSHTIVTDIDTICVKPCIDYLEEQIAIDPGTFCLTNWYNDVNLSVGLCVYNTNKYRNVFLPLLMKHHWSSHRRDGTFIQHVRTCEPDCLDQLDIRLFNKNKISTERFHRSKVRKNYWTEDTMFYHAWKGELRKGGDDFLRYYQEVLDDLKAKP